MIRTLCLTPLLAAFAGLLFLPAPVEADCAVRSRRVFVNHAPAVVVQRVAVVKKVALLPVEVYSPKILVLNGYSPYAIPTPPVAPTLTPPAASLPPSPARSTSDLSDTQAIILLLQRMEVRLKAVESAINLPAPREEKLPAKATSKPGEDAAGPSSSTPAKATHGEKDARALAVFTSACSKCHTEGKLNAKTDFVMFSAGGKLKDFTDRQTLKITVRSYNGTMPPKSEKPLEDADVADIQEWAATKK